MALFYPHRQTVIIALACALAVTGTFLYARRQTAAAGKAGFAAVALENSLGNSLTAQEIASSSLSGNWQKDFYSLATGTAPVLQQPTADAPVDNQPQTLTGQFGKDFMARMMLLQQDNLTNDPQSVKTVIDQSMNEFASSAPRPVAYGQKDIIISSQTGTDADRAYANEAGAVLLAHTPQGDPATLASQALAQNDPSAIASVDAITRAYSSTIGDLLKIKVPAELVSLDIDLLNGVSSMQFISQGMGKVFSDPAQGLVALGMYGSAQDSLHGALLELKAYFDQKGIVFKSTEPATVISTTQ